MQHSIYSAEEKIHFQTLFYILVTVDKNILHSLEVRISQFHFQTWVISSSHTPTIMFYIWKIIECTVNWSLKYILQILFMLE